MPEELRIVVTDAGVTDSDGRAVTGGGPTSRPASATDDRRERQAKVPEPPPFPREPPLPKPERPQVSRERFDASARAGISRAEQIGTALAAGRVGGAVAGIGAAAAAITGPVGIAIAGVVSAFTIAGVAIRAFAKSVQTQTAALAGLSPALAVAQAETEIRRFRAELRRARRIGPALAGAERLRSRFEEQVTNIGTEIQAILLRVLEGFEPAARQLLTALEALSLVLAERGAPIAGFLTGAFRAAFPGAAAIIDRLTQIAQNTAKDELEGLGELPGPFAQEFMNLLPTAPPFWPEGQPLPVFRNVPGI